MIGTEISHYRIIEKLGEGGMGEVYVAKDVRLDRTVALKALPARFSQDPQRRKRFAGEARAAAMLNHPSIAAVYEFIEQGEDLYIAMELVSGESLRTFIEPPLLPLKDILDISVQITRGLNAAHSHGVVHRDLKPENILRTEDGAVKILDFGLARLVPVFPEGTTQTGHLTSTGMLMGTVSYMSPEQLEAKPADARSDIFSVGVIMYELATGAHPFGGASNASMIANILTLEPRPLSSLSTVAPLELERIIWKCLRKDPRNRYQSAKELLADLDSLCALSIPRNSDPTKRTTGPQTIVNRALRMVEPSPQRWWELNQYICLIAFPLVAFWIWRIRDWLSAEWSAFIVFAMVLLVSSSMTMRLYLLMTAGFHADTLHEEVIRWSGAIRIMTLLMWVLLAVVAALISRQHLGVGSLMGGVAVGGCLSTIVAESAIDRRAFPR